MSILIADDELVTLETIAFTLQAEGFDVITACDGKKALEIINDEDKKIDLVISDIMMPNVSGLGLLATLHHRYGNKLPVIFISALDHGHLISSLSIGTTEFIGKPLDFDELVSRVKKLTAVARPS